MELILKVQQFLEEEQELLADFLLDIENAISNKEQATATALWSMQTARVGAIKDVLELLGFTTDEEQVLSV